MNVKIYSRDFNLPKSTEDYIWSQINVSISKYRAYIQSLDVSLLIVGEEYEGISLKCRTRVKLFGAPSIIVQATDTNVYKAIFESISSAATAVIRYDFSTTSARSA